MGRPKRGDRHTYRLHPATVAELRAVADRLGLDPSGLVEQSAAWIEAPEPEPEPEPEPLKVRIPPGAAAKIDSFPGRSKSAKFRGFWKAVKKSAEFRRIGLDVGTDSP